MMTLWDVASGRRVRDLPGIVQSGGQLAIAANGEWVARWCGNTAWLWHAGRWGSAMRKSKDTKRRFAAVFSPPRYPLALELGHSTRPCIYELSSEKLRNAQGPAHRNLITAQAYSRDGATLATAGVEGSIILWDVATLEIRFQFYGNNAEVKSLAFSPDSRTLASGAEDGLVTLWDLATGMELATFAGHTGPIIHVRFTEDGLTLATCAKLPAGDTEVFLWRTAQRR